MQCSRLLISYECYFEIVAQAFRRILSTFSGKILPLRMRTHDLSQINHHHHRYENADIANNVITIMQLVSVCVKAKAMMIRTEHDSCEIFHLWYMPDFKIN